MRYVIFQIYRSNSFFVPYGVDPSDHQYFYFRIDLGIHGARQNPERRSTMSIEHEPEALSNPSDNTILQDTYSSDPITSAAVTKKLLWRKVKRGKEWLAKHNNSQDYVLCMRNKDKNYRLTMIDNPAREESCEAATIKQWDTIIRQAKEADRVPNAAKLAKFYRLGFTTGDPCLKAGLDGIPRLKKTFQRVLDEKDLDGIVSKLPLPVKDFTQAKYQKKPESEKVEGEKEFLEEPDVVDEKISTNNKMKRLPVHHLITY